MIRLLIIAILLAGCARPDPTAPVEAPPGGTLWDDPGVDHCKSIVFGWAELDLSRRQAEAVYDDGYRAPVSDECVEFILHGP